MIHKLENYAQLKTLFWEFRMSAKRLFAAALALPLMRSQM
jgi:hypothetical protein